jgi:hypothetical protein
MAQATELRRSVAAALQPPARRMAAAKAPYAVVGEFSAVEHIAVVKRGLPAQWLNTLAAAVDHARKSGLRGVTLTTFAHIPWNAPFYAKNGFVELAPAHVGPGLAERIERERELGLVDRVAMWHSGDGALSRAHLQ